MKERRAESCGAKKQSKSTIIFYLIKIECKMKHLIICDWNTMPRCDLYKMKI